MCDNGPPMAARATRAFLTLWRSRSTRPARTPTDQAWIESLIGTIKIECPHLLALEDSPILRAELARVREQYNGVRLHAAIGYVTPDDEH